MGKLPPPFPEISYRWVAAGFTLSAQPMRSLSPRAFSSSLRDFWLLVKSIPSTAALRLSPSPTWWCKVRERDQFQIFPWDNAQCWLWDGSAPQHGRSPALAAGCKMQCWSFCWTLRCPREMSPAMVSIAEGENWAHPPTAHLGVMSVMGARQSNPRTAAPACASCTCPERPWAVMSHPSSSESVL